MGKGSGGCNDRPGLQLASTVNSSIKVSELTPDMIIINSIESYPMLHTDRNEVIEHMFCTLGSGYKWHEGKLIETWQLDDAGERWTPTPPEALPLTVTLADLDSNIAHLYQTLYGDKPDKMAQRLREEEQHNRELRVIQEAAEQRAEQKFPVLTVYPMERKYTNLANIPDDVHTAWLDLAQEAVDLVLEVDGRCKEECLSHEALEEYCRNHPTKAANIRRAQKLGHVGNTPQQRDTQAERNVRIARDAQKRIDKIRAERAS